MPYTYDYPRPAVAADAAVFALRGGGLKVCLVRRKNPPYAGRWVMPGGFLDIAERAEAAARRELEEETGIAQASLAFLGPYDDPGRDPRGRLISLAFFGVVGPRARLQAGDDAAEAIWADAHSPPALAFDHAAMLRHAQERLERAGRWSSMLFGLLDSPFALSQVREAYEAVYPDQLGESQAFEKGLLEAGILRPVDCGEEASLREQDLYALRPDANAVLEAGDKPLFTPHPKTSSAG